MNTSIFRQKNIDKLRSPESLNDYVRVASPGVWLLLAAIVALLAGACIWGIFGRINTTVDALAVAQNNTVSFFVSGENAGRVPEDVTATVGENSFSFELHERTEGALEQFDQAGVFVGSAKTDMPDGVYAAEVVVESIDPMSFVLN